LGEMYSSNRVKELLAQGTNNRYEKNPEQEKIEKKRQLPFHMHINLELLESVHLICAMLLEVPNMAQNAYDPKKKIISRNFRKYYDHAKVFNGPPESTRDIIITAARSLAKGDWKRCESLLLGLPVWNLLPKTDQVKSMLRGRIQEEGLRTFFFTYGKHYDSLSLEQLSQIFELKHQNVHQIVSKMMTNEELNASWDQPTCSIVMHRVEPTRFQYLALQLAEKVAQLGDYNEKMLDTKTGNFGYKGEQKGEQNQGQRRDNRSQYYGPYDQRQNQDKRNRKQGQQRIIGTRGQIKGNRNQRNNNQRRERNYDNNFNSQE